MSCLGIKIEPFLVNRNDITIICDFLMNLMDCDDPKEKLILYGNRNNELFDMIENDSVCENCRKFRDLTDNNFHTEAENYEECGSCLPEYIDLSEYILLSIFNITDKNHTYNIILTK